MIETEKENMMSLRTENAYAKKLYNLMAYPTSMVVTENGNCLFLVSWLLTLVMTIVAVNLVPWLVPVLTTYGPFTGTRLDFEVTFEVN